MNIYRIAGPMIAFMLAFATSARAELRHIEITTLGMDWEICAHAVSVAMKKLPAVVQVRVSLNHGLTVLDLKPGNTATVAELRQIIKNNGFVSKEATAVARGTVADEGTFVVSGTNERLSLSSPPQRSGDDWRLTVRAPDKPSSFGAATPGPGRLRGRGERQNAFFTRWRRAASCTIAQRRHLIADIFPAVSADGSPEQGSLDGKIPSLRQLVPMEAENETKRFFQEGWNRISHVGFSSSSCSRPDHTRVGAFTAEKWRATRRHFLHPAAGHI
jgi:hypothetical protein